jgi:hypothetical protein
LDLSESEREERPVADVRVLIPWRPGCPWREADLRMVRAWWEQAHPQWPVTLGTYQQPLGLWRKGAAVSRGGPWRDHMVMVVADADVICPQVADAVAAVRKAGGWAVPHHRVAWLSKAATAEALHSSRLPAIPTGRQMRREIATVEPAVLGGGVVVTTGRLLREVPIDPRFAGAADEDRAWALALCRLAGLPWQGTGMLRHLWHPRPPEVSGSLERATLHDRYQTAITPDLMRSLALEAQKALTRRLEPAPWISRIGS